MMSAAESKSQMDGMNQSESGHEPGVDPRLLEVLVCPVSRSAL